MLHEIAQEENKAPEPAADTMPDIGTQADELPDIDLNEPLGEPLYEDLPEAEEDVFSEPKLKISKRPERKKRPQKEELKVEAPQETIKEPAQETLPESQPEHTAPQAETEPTQQKRKKQQKSRRKN